MSEKETIFKGLFESVVVGDVEAAKDYARRSLAQGVPSLQTVDEGLTAGIREVGRRFGCGEAFLPEMVLAADAMQAALEILKPHLEGRKVEKKGKILIATVQGDIHDIGKNIAAALLSVNGYEVIDIGRNVSPATLVDRATEQGVDIVGMSALMTTSLPYLAETIELMKQDGVRGRFKVVIGGGPTNQPYADKIGADGYANTASDGVLLCDRLLEALA